MPSATCVSSSAEIHNHGSARRHAAMSTSKITVFVSAWAPGFKRGHAQLAGNAYRRLHRFPEQADGRAVSTFRGRRHVSMSTNTEDGGVSKPTAADVARSTGIVSADLKEEMSRSYMEYAMSVILGRAMPDVRDGLKPVHRRILFAMHDLGLNPGGRFRKSARVVGEVLGKYHPHGDTSVYDALVRMSQDFSMGVPLVDGHGNFGSTDGDPPAAMRYTECKLTKITRDGFFEDIDKDTVERSANFDGSEMEPLVLPARFPNLLLNGSSGIAVGMATNIPPHNLGELAAALHALIADPHLSDDELLALVPGPDFPTGGQILGRAGCRDMYLTGRGRVAVRACAHQELISGGGSGTRKQPRTAIVVTELPYQVNKANLVANIADLVNSKKLEGIADLRDESDRSGTRIVIELKRDAELSIVLNNLFRKTYLQTSFAANVMALDNGRFPIRLTLRDCLLKFLEFRRETVRRRVEFDLRNAVAREHYVDGYLIVQRNCDKVVKTIRGSKDSVTAKRELIRLYGLTELQADSVLSMQLRRLTSLEQDRLEKEKLGLIERIADYHATLADDAKVDAIIGDELTTISEKFAVPRRSVIMETAGESGVDIDELSLVPNDRSVIVVTEQGYIKRMAATSFGSQNRGTRGKKGVGRLRENDMIAHFFACMTHDKLLVVSKSGIAYDLPAHKVPLGNPSTRGVPVFQLLPHIEVGTTMASVLPVTQCKEDEYLVLATQHGVIKKTALSAFEVNNSLGKRIIRIDEDDELRWVRRCTSADTIIFASENGLVARISASDDSIRPLGRTARGVMAMRLNHGDAIAGMDIVEGGDSDEDASGEKYVLVTTALGDGKRLPADVFPIIRRGGKGKRAIKFKDGDDRIISLGTCTEEDSVMLATRDGTIVRFRIARLPMRKLTRSKGLMMQRLDEGDAVAAVTILPKELGGDDEDGDEDGDEDDEEVEVEEEDVDNEELQ